MESILETSNGLQEIMLEFRAGKMFLEGKHVIPDTRKGLIRIAKGEEGLIHFMWLDRMQNVVEDDQIIFPDEAVFEKVDQTSGRVYILKFSTDDRKFFFWMQEPKADDDPHLCLSVNYYINRPLEFLPDEEPEASAAVQSLEDMVEEDISSRAGNLVGPSLGAEVTSDVSSSPGPVKMADLQRILSSIGSADTADDAADSDGGLGLGDLLKPDLILPLLETLPIEERLSPYLPEGQRTLDDLMELLQSPPFRQQVDSFTYVLRTGQIDLSQFGIEPSKYKLSVLSFLEALEDSVATSENVDTRTQSRGCSEPMDEGQ